MPPLIAVLVFVVGVGGLFYLNRDSSAHTSKGLWLPVIWLWLHGSRSVAAWLSLSVRDDSPIDQILGGILMLLGIIVLARRKHILILLKNSWPIALYFSYSLVSVAWSDFPGHGAKRWFKALGDLVMVLVLVTDIQPAQALKRFFSRAGFILLPASILLLRYFPNLSHGYDPWGRQTNTGVTTDKNMLGVVTLVLALGAFWQILDLLRDKERRNRSRQLLAQGVLLYFGISLLFAAHSATSGACFLLGSGLMVATSRPVFRNRPRAVHALVFAIVLVGVTTVLLGGQGAAAEAMGRDAHFHGRTEVWELLITMSPNPLVGAGFENFWFGPRLDRIWYIYPGTNEAHDGYLEVFLNLGVLGLGTILLLLIKGYLNAVAAFRRDPALGNLLVAIILTAAIYSITEAGFRMLDPIWIALLFSILAAGRLTLTYDGSSLSGQEPPGPFSGKSERLSRPRTSFERKLESKAILK
jgi:exopolysaccharide production protein ExoQ